MPDKFIAYGRSGQLRLDHKPRARTSGKYGIAITMTRDGRTFLGVARFWRKAWEAAHLKVAQYVTSRSRKESK